MTVEPARPQPSRAVLPLVVLALAVLRAGPYLWESWQVDVYARGAIIAFALWIPPALYRVAVPSGRGTGFQWMLAALCAGVAGAGSSLRVLDSIALACAIGALARPRDFQLLWVPACLAWIPASGWFFSRITGGGLAGWERPLIAFAGTAAFFILERRRVKKSSQPMSDRTKRRIVIGVFGVVVLAMLVWPMIPLKTAEARLSSIPASGPGFTTKVIPLTDTDRKLLGDASAVCLMVTMNNGTRLMLTVIDGTRNRHAVHDPFYCFAGAGWTVESKHPVAMGAGEGTFLSMRKDGKKSEALCFYDDGTRQYASPFRYWLSTSWRRVTLGAGGDEPVLVLCRTLPGETAGWERIRHLVLPALGFR